MFDVDPKKELPTNVRDASVKVMDLPTQLIGIFLFLGVSFGDVLGSFWPFLNESFFSLPLSYVRVFFLLLFLGYVIWVSNRINKELGIKGTNIANEYNREGDKALFEASIKSGEFKIFDLRKILFLFFVIPSCFLIEVFGILALYEALIVGVNEFLIMGLIATIVPFFGAFLFAFESKRILTYARLVNSFVKEAEKGWLISKSAFIIFVLLSIIAAFLIISSGNNFLEKGGIYQNGSLIYNGGKMLPQAERDLNILADCLKYAPWINTCTGAVSELVIDKNYIKQNISPRFLLPVELCLVADNSNSYNKDGNIIIKNQYYFESICVAGQSQYLTEDDFKRKQFDINFDKFIEMKNKCPSLNSCFYDDKFCCIGVFR
jgi:hypothetical protein